jgi:hypothetical protein
MDASITGYESTFKDFLYLLDVGSEKDLLEVATALGLTARVAGMDTHFYTADGRKLALEAVHQAGQADLQVQRLIYNLWMTYAH